MSEGYPRRWTTTSLREVCVSLTDGDHQAPPKAESGVPFITISAMNDGALDLARASRFVPRSYYDALSPERKARRGDILFSVTGSVGIAAPVAVEAPFVFQRHIAILRPDPRIVDDAYLLHLLRSTTVREFLARQATGTAQMTIPLGALRALSVSLPPLAEQRRIVARIEALFARTRRARAELERVAPLTKRYWERRLAVVFDPETAEQISTLGAIVTEGPQNGYSPPAHQGPEGTMSLRLTATTSGHLDLSERAVKRLAEVIAPHSRFWLRSGDLLLQRANALEHLGAAAIYEGPEDTYIYPDLMMRIRLPSAAMTRYVWRYLNSPAARQHYRDRATGTAGNMPKINSTVVRGLPVPLFNPGTIAQVNRDLDASERATRLASSEATRALALLDRLEQSILAKAFRGELVPQDPSEEPATALLARLQPSTTAPRRGRPRQAARA